MTTTVTANELLAPSGYQGIAIPPGHVGPVLLSDTGRTVWWTGRVAIGLLYEPRPTAEQPGASALHLQEALLRRNSGTACSSHPG